MSGSRPLRGLTEEIPYTASLSRPLRLGVWELIMDALDRLPGSKKFSLPITPVEPKIKTGAGKIVRELTEIRP